MTALLIGDVQSILHLSYNVLIGDIQSFFSPLWMVILIPVCFVTALLIGDVQSIRHLIHYVLIGDIFYFIISFSSGVSSIGRSQRTPPPPFAVPVEENQ